MENKMKIAVLGCGNMGSAIIGGIKKHFGDTWQVVAYDPFRQAVDALGDLVQYEEPSEWFKTTTPDIVLLAVKPQIIKKALEVFSKSTDTTVWISIAAGVSLSSLEAALPRDAKVCKVMPNTPAMIGSAMSGFTLNTLCKNKDREKVTALLETIGKYIEVPEYQMDAVTGLSGSGPAYVYMIIEALADGGVAAGLPYAEALKSAVQTVKGAAEMVEKSGESPAVLRSRVMSPGGTTAAAVKALENGGLRSALINGVVASAERAKELG